MFYVRNCPNHSTPNPEQTATQEVCAHVYLTQSVFKCVLQKSIPTQIRQPILYLSNSKRLVDGFVGGLPSGKRGVARQPGVAGGGAAARQAHCLRGYRYSI